MYTKTQSEEGTRDVNNILVTVNTQIQNIKLIKMAFERHLFITKIEIFWVHTALSFDDCWKHCLEWFSRREFFLFFSEKLKTNKR